MKSSIMLFITATLLCVFLATTTVNADSMFVGGVEYPLVDGIAPLYQYVDKPDPYFEWHEIVGFEPHNNTKKGFVSYRLEFTSQKWLTDNDTDRSVWRHNLTIVVPYQVELEGIASLYITGCSMDNEKCPDEQSATVEDVAIKSKSILATLTQVPNQSVVFYDDPELLSRSEDAAVAWTWKHVVETPSRPDWMLYFPMTKAAIAATRVLKEWSLKNTNIVKPIEQFYLSGASKRGATTWFASAYMGQYSPKNILGAAPLVFDTLNATHTIPNMYENLGGWTFAFQDYRDAGIVSVVNDPVKFATLAQHIDPLAPWYRQGLEVVPKLIVSAVGDEFFLLQNDRFYYDTLPNRLRLQIPDAEHSLITGITYLHNGTAGHLRQLALKKPLPQWKHYLNYEKANISLYLDVKPTSISVFKAQTPPSVPNRRDFRLIKANIEGGCLPPAFVINDELCGSPTWWKATNITETGTLESGFWKYEYTAKYEEIPTDGTFFGFYLIAAWENHPTMGNQVYSTQIMVLPDKLPFANCQPNCGVDMV